MFFLADPGEDPELKRAHMAAIDARQAERRENCRTEKADDATFEARRIACRSCDEYVPETDHCRKLCKCCNLAAKMRIATAVCPAGRWPFTVAPAKETTRRLLESGDPRYVARIAACRQCSEFSGVTASCRAARNLVYLLASNAVAVCPSNKWKPVENLYNQSANV